MNTTIKSSLLERRNLLQKNTYDKTELVSDILPMPTGLARMAALRDLGATFEEGQKSIAKVATPNETIVPSFVDSNYLEVIKMNTTLVSIFNHFFVVVVKQKQNSCVKQMYIYYQ
jgi:hypothetical protein